MSKSKKSRAKIVRILAQFLLEDESGTLAARYIEQLRKKKQVGEFEEWYIWKEAEDRAYPEIWK